MARIACRSWRTVDGLLEVGGVCDLAGRPLDNEDTEQICNLLMCVGLNQSIPTDFRAGAFLYRGQKR